VVVWGIATRESAEEVREWAELFDIDIPLLLDADGAVSALYQGTMAFPTGAYPQEWLIGTDGVILHYANEFEVDVLIALIEAELAED
jgi:peroxiredoxin